MILVNSLLRRFAKSCGNGSVVNIPMADPVESMNTASALAVILFELRRQIHSDGR